VKTSTITVKGQVTVPKEVRDAFGWKAGDRLAFVRGEDGVRVVKAKRRGRGAAVVESLKRANWDRRLSTRQLMAMTRGERQPK
jgi:AbrB family looped-hinge helix DNA binding protein